MNVVYGKERPRGGLFRRLARWALFFVAVVGVAGGGAGLVA